MTTEIETVYNAADELVSEGTTPSVRAVTARIGGGSATYVAPYLALWKTREATLGAAAGLPEQFLEDARVFAVHLWDAAAEYSDIEKQALVREIDRLRKETLASETDLLVENAALKARCEESDITIATMSARMSDLEGQLEQKEKQIKDADEARAQTVDRMLAADARHTDHYDSARKDVAEYKREIEDWRTRSNRSENRVEVLEEQVRQAEERRLQDAKRIDVLVAEIVALAGRKSSPKPRTDLAMPPQG